MSSDFLLSDIVSNYEKKVLGPLCCCVFFSSQNEKIAFRVNSILLRENRWSGNCRDCVVFIKSALKKSFPILETHVQTWIASLEITMCFGTNMTVLTKSEAFCTWKKRCAFEIYFTFLLHVGRRFLEWFCCVFSFYQFFPLKGSFAISVTGDLTWSPTLDDVVTSETNMTLTVIATDASGAESILTLNIKLCPCASGTCMYNESLVGSENYEVK